MNRVLYYVSCIVLSVSFLAYLLSFFGINLEGLMVLPLIVSVIVMWFFAIKEIKRRAAILKKENTLIEKNESFFEAHKTMQKNMKIVIFQGVPIWAKRSAIFIFYAAFVSFIMNAIIGGMVAEGQIGDAYFTRMMTGHFMAFSVISTIVLYPTQGSSEK